MALVNKYLVTDGDVLPSYDSSNGVKIGKVGGRDIYAPKLTAYYNQGTVIGTLANQNLIVPQATSSQLGLVKPVAATAAMTQNVGVKSDGSLVTTPSSGGGGVTQIVAGSNVTISPASGTGAVTINATGGGSGGVTKLVAGSNITLSPAGGTGEVTISASGGGGGGGILGGHSLSLYYFDDYIGTSWALGDQAIIVYADGTSSFAGVNDSFANVAFVILLFDKNTRASGDRDMYVVIDGKTFTFNDTSYDSSVNLPVGIFTIPVWKDGFSIGIMPSAACFLAGTRINTALDIQKNIEDITYDDELLAWDFDNGRITSAKPIWIKRGEIGTHYWRNEFASGRVVLTTGNEYGHRFFDGEAGAFVPNTECNVSFNIDGKEDRLVKCERIDEPCEYYNVITDKHFNLFANGILASTSLNNLYPIRGMKFDKSGAVKREWTGRAFGRGLIEGLRLAEQPRTVAETETYVNRLIERMV